MANPLNDKEFLQKLDLDRNKEIFAKVIALTKDELPVEELQGKVTAGSINIDGTSTVRRTCSLTMVADEVNIQDYYWGFKTKFQLFVGVRNNIDSQYDDIIWFKQGIFVITSFSTSLSTNNYTINISGKDKMCLLNGELGGSFPSSIDFGTEEYEDLENLTTTITEIPVKDIILNLVNVYGNESIRNISIQDVEDHGLELMEYRGDDPLYVYRNIEEGVFDNLSPYGTDQVYTNDTCTTTIALQDIPIYDSCISDLNTTGTTAGSLDNFTHVWLKDAQGTITEYTIAKLEYGDTVGYRLTDLTYAGDLIANVGESITSILDKIKNMLGNFEYFYDIDGKFVFREKRSYVNTSYSTLMTDDDETYAENANYSSETIYDFNNNELITQINNNPTLSNVKNDYTVWGQRKSISGSTTIPVHMRVAIDNKPIVYKTISVDTTLAQALVDQFPEYYPGTADKYVQSSVTYCTSDFTGTGTIVDWREIIYQMAKDYYQYNRMDLVYDGGYANFYNKVMETNIFNNEILYPEGKTGYEQYYADIQGFWRQLYDTAPESIDKGDTSQVVFADSGIGPQKNTTYYQWDENKHDYRSLEFAEITAVRSPTSQPSGQTYYYKNNANEMKELTTTDINNLPNGLFKESVTYYAKTSSGEYEPINIYYFLTYNITKDGATYYSATAPLYDNCNINQGTNWTMTLQSSPQSLNFWFDFLDSNSELNQYSIPSIGDRAKAVNDSKTTAIYFKETPDIIIYTKDSEIANIRQDGYVYIRIPTSLDDYFSISSQGKSAKEYIDDLLYEYSYATTSITITSVPIYYLEPNRLISVNDKKTNINGNYLVTKLTIPLTYNGTMSITATKAVDRIY